MSESTDVGADDLSFVCIEQLSDLFLEKSLTLPVLFSSCS